MLKLFKIGCCFLFVVVTMTNCSFSDPVEIKDGLQSFDVSSDGTFFILSWNLGHNRCLFRTGIDGENPKLLIDSSKMILAYNPRISSNGEKIVFLKGVPDTFNSSICTVNINGDSLIQLTTANSIKTEAVMSQNGKNIYFAQANEYAAYSPLARKAAHDFDIYSVGLDKKKVSKISSFHAYSLSFINEIDSTRLTFGMQGEERGIFFYEKATAALNKVSIKDDSLSYSKGFSNPIVINDSTIICTSYYVLVNINTKRREQKILTLPSALDIGTVRYNKKLRRIFFTGRNNLNEIYSMNLDGSDLKTISIQKI